MRGIIYTRKSLNNLFKMGLADERLGRSHQIVFGKGE